MKKEVLFAIIIGFALGLAITFGIRTANKAFQGSAQQEEAPIEEILPTPTPLPSLSLTITSPEDNVISDQETIEVSGKTASEAVIVILYPEGEKILEADKNGRFSTEIDLAGGDNEIKISSYDNENNEASQTLTVVYSTAEI